MRHRLIEFGRAARDADIAVVFFAGHGIEIGGENWLIPVDAQLLHDTDSEAEAISLHLAMAQVSSARRLGMVILDACRNNPFAASMQRRGNNRAVERGLARVEPSGNMLVAYAARDGTTAGDGAGRNSPFTAALLRNLETPGLDVRFMFAAVRDDVMEATRRAQEPFIYGSLSRQEIYLKAPTEQNARPAQGPCGARALLVASNATLSAAEECALRPQDTFRECRQCPEMVVVPPGSFTMGSPEGEKGRGKDEGPTHLVTFQLPLAVGKFEVTVDQFAAFVTETGYGPGPGCDVFNGNEIDARSSGGKFDERTDRSWREPGFAQDGSHPVACVSWNDAKAYAACFRRRPAATTGCFRRPSGNTRRGGACRPRPDQLRAIPSAMTRRRCAATATWLIGLQGATCSPQGAARFSRATMVMPTRRRPGASCPMASAFTTCSAMSGSGWRTATATAMPARQVTARHGFRGTAATACCVAGRGSTVPPCCGRHIVPGAAPATGPTATAFEWPGRCQCRDHLKRAACRVGTAAEVTQGSLS